ncbi:hypothetical protein [Desulfovibrio sp. Huiquan2017]|uniref:hypothetical protein n=1 Tax=Desulfovibrio sp. Huiquan2017 TaxID=2816861 RepID=UPI001A91D7A6|nr:hypothetical protein [Desulfovibrio sp. Huiquan2017]
MTDTNQVTDISVDQKQKSRIRKPVALDRMFPPLWFMGGLIFLVSLLLLAMGWKIMALEEERTEWRTTAAQERNELALAKQELQLQQQQLIEQVARHREILTQLPLLEEKSVNLTQKVAVLQSEKDTLEIRLKTASEQMTAALGKNEKAQQEMQDALKRRDGARTEFNALSKQTEGLQSEVDALSRKGNALNDRVTSLQGQQITLEKDIAELRQTHDELDTRVANLKNQITGKTQALQALQQDGQVYASLTKGFQDILANFKNLNRETDQTVNSLKTEAEALTALAEIKGKAVQAAEGLQTEAVNAHKTVGALEQEKERIQDATSELSRRVAKFAEQAERVQNLADKTGQGVSQFTSVTSKLGDEYQTIQESNQGFSSQISKLKQSLEQISENTITLVEEISTLKTASASAVQLGKKTNRFDALLTNLESFAHKLNAMASDLKDRSSDSPGKGQQAISDTNSKPQ